MTDLGTKVGRSDALPWRVVGSATVLAGLVSLDGFYEALSLLTWIVLAVMVTVGLFFLTGGWRRGTGGLGVLMMILAVLDGWLTITHEGHWALIVGAIVAAAGLVTGRVSQSRAPGHEPHRLHTGLKSGTVSARKLP